MEGHRRRNLILMTVLLILVANLLSGCFAIIDARMHRAASLALLEVSYDESNVVRDQRYSGIERGLYDLYLPEDRTTERARHLVLYIHGGSWTSGDKSKGRLWCRFIASKGYTAATMNYTLNDGKSKTNVLAINEEVKQAVTAIKARCAEADIGIDLIDMAIKGYSAGGCQAMLYGFREQGTSKIPLKFIVQQSGPTTFDPAVWRNGEIHFVMARSTGLDGSRDGDAQWLSSFSGMEISADEIGTQKEKDILDLINPVAYIKSDSPPILFAYGSLDGVVPPTSRIVLENALKESSVPYTSIVLPSSGHYLAYDLDRQKEFLDALLDYCRVYFLGEAW